jgi:hypothetical protein
LKENIHAESAAKLRASNRQTFDGMNCWLDKCNSVYRLDFSPKQRIGETAEIIEVISLHSIIDTITKVNIEAARITILIAHLAEALWKIV